LECWHEFLFFCDEDCTEGEHEFDDDLGDDSSEEVSLGEDDETYDYADDDSDEVDVEEEILFVGGDEEVVEDLFDEAEDEHYSQKW
jgi:hypothetical protein